MTHARRIRWFLSVLLGAVVPWLAHDEWAVRERAQAVLTWAYPLSDDACLAGRRSKWPEVAARSCEAQNNGWRQHGWRVRAAWEVTDGQLMEARVAYGREFAAALADIIVTPFAWDLAVWYMILCESESDGLPWAALAWHRLGRFDGCRRAVVRAGRLLTPGATLGCDPKLDAHYTCQAPDGRVTVHSACRRDLAGLDNLRFAARGLPDPTAFLRRNGDDGLRKLKALWAERKGRP